MGVLHCASAASAWRGYEYYKAGRVQMLKETEEGCYDAMVTGTADPPYIVYLETAHPRRSTCDCPHANGKRIVCKHIVATYFAAHPEEAEAYYRACAEAEEEEERHAEEVEVRLQNFVARMKKSELQEALLQLLFDGPEWQYQEFVESNGLDEW